MTQEEIKECIKERIATFLFGEANEISFTEAYIKNSTSMIRNDFTLYKGHLDGLFPNGDRILQSNYPKIKEGETKSYVFNGPAKRNSNPCFVELTRYDGQIDIDLHGTSYLIEYEDEGQTKESRTAYNFKDFIKDDRIDDHDIYISIIYPARNAAQIAPIVTIFIVDKEKSDRILKQTQIFDPIVILQYIFEANEFEMDDSLLKPIWNSLFKDIKYEYFETIKYSEKISKNTSELLIPRIER